MTKNSPTSYWRESRKPIYSFLLSIPLIVFYEIGIFIINSEDLYELRNGADVLIRNLLESSGIIGIQSSGIILCIGFILVLIIQRNSVFNTNFVKDYFPVMVLESLGWSILLYMSMGVFRISFFGMPTGNVWFAQIVMSLGAGIYEEIIFRLVLITFISKSLSLIFNWYDFICYFYGIILSAALFSVFHFIGVYGDVPDFPLFMVRFLGGCFLGCLFLVRGFGITAYTHCIYDLIVVVNQNT